MIRVSLPNWIDHYYIGFKVFWYDNWRRRHKHLIQRHKRYAFFGKLNPTSSYSASLNQIVMVINWCFNLVLTSICVPNTVQKVSRHLVALSNKTWNEDVAWIKSWKFLMLIMEWWWETPNEKYMQYLTFSILTQYKGPFPVISHVMSILMKLQFEVYDIFHRSASNQVLTLV